MSKRIVALVLCCGFALLPSLVIEPERGTSLDGSWMIGLTAAAERGEVSGRDLYATYGWLFQQIGRLAVALHAGPPLPSSAYDALPLLIVLLNLGGILGLGLSLLLMQRVGWRMIVLVFVVFALLGFFGYMLVRLGAALLAVTVLQRASGAESPAARRAGALAAGFLCLAAQLLTFDMGIFAFASAAGGLLALALASAWLSWLPTSAPAGPPTPPHRRFRLRFASSTPSPATGSPSGLPPPRECLLLLALLTAGYGLGNLGVSLIFRLTSHRAPHGLFAYQRTLLDLVRGYNRAESFPWSLDRAASCLALLCLLAVVLFLAQDARRLRRADLSLFVFLLVFSGVVLKSALVRSDPIHISFGLTPLLLTFVLAGRDWRGTGRLRPAWALLLVVFIAVWPGTSIDPFLSLGALLRGNLAPARQLAAMRRFRGSAEVPIPKVLAAPPRRLALNAPNAPHAPGEPGLFVFPYQNYLAVVAGRRPVAPIIQAYQATTTELQRLEIERLERESGEVEVLYTFDKGPPPREPASPAGGTLPPLAGGFPASPAAAPASIVMAAPPPPGRLRSWQGPARQFLAGKLEGVQQVTRSPVLFEHLYADYRVIAEDAGEPVALLARRERPRPLAGEALAFTQEAGGGPYGRVALRSPATCALVRLTLEVRYPRLALVGRASQFRLRFERRGELRVPAIAFALAEGRPFETFVSLTPPESFPELLGDGPPGRVAGTEWDSLDIEPLDTGLFGFAPRSVEIRRLECLRF